MKIDRSNLPEVDMIALCNTLIDDMCDTRGVWETIWYLHDSGLSFDELQTLQFTYEDIENALSDKEKE